MAASSSAYMNVTAGSSGLMENGELHQYDESFPPLGAGTNPSSSAPLGILAGNKQSPIGTPKRLPPRVSPAKPPSLSSHTVNKSGKSVGGTSATLIISPEERRFQQVNMAGEGADAAAQRRICQDIAARTHVTVDLHVNKDRSLSISITGKPDAVQEARRSLARDLVTQGQLKLDIPQEYYRFILGKGGARLQEIEQRTGAKINVPGNRQSGEDISIMGSKDALQAAKDELLAIYHDQSRRAQESLTIPKVFHPFICGPNNRYMDELMSKTGAKVNVPPMNVQSDIITITGEKEGVAIAKKELETRYHAVQKDCSTLNFHIAKSQHRYVIGVRGSGLSEILEQTGVSVEMPSADDRSEEITLRGPESELGRALSLVIQRAQSVMHKTVPAPLWLHRYLIGPKGSNLARITGDREKLRVDFSENEELISIEGSKKDVEEVADELSREVKQLQSKLCYEELSGVSPVYHKHIIGKAGSNIERMQQEFGVQLKLMSSGVVRIEGPREGVAHARQQIESLVQKLENEKQKDIIIDHRFHRHIIGAQGSRIRELRERYPNVQVNFPDMGMKSNIVQLRGPRQDVDAVAQVLMNTYKELANVEELTVDIPSTLHAALIGSKGHVLRNIQVECGGGVQIKFPKLDKSAVTEDKGAKNATTADKVIVRGPKEEVHKAKQLLLQLAKEKEALSYEETVTCRQTLHKFLIGKGGSNLQEVRQATGARVILPTLSVGEVSEDISTPAGQPDIITIIGSKEAVVKAKELLQKRIAELENMEERTVHIDPKWHRNFVQRRGQLLNTIAQECGGVNISFPSRAEEGQESSDVVRVKGPGKCVEAAVARLLEVVHDLESQVTIDVHIPAQYHRALIGASGQQVRDIQDQYKVAIRFPPPSSAGGQHGGDFPAEGAPQDDTLESNNTADVIHISGNIECCEQAKQALLQLVPVEEEIPLVNEYHGLLIGPKGQTIQQLQREHSIQIQIPESSLNASTIGVKATPERIERFKESLAKMVKEWDAEKEDRLARSYEVECFVPVAYHRQLIGPRGVKINEFINKYEVFIHMPQSGGGKRRGEAHTTHTEEEKEDNDTNQEDTEASSPTENAPPAAEEEAAKSNASERIVIRGYKEKADAARLAILDRVEFLKKLVTVELNLPNEIHNRIIGQRGWNLRRLVEEYGVEDIAFPAFGAADKDLVVVSGLPEKVDPCCDHLVDLANEYMDQYEERKMMNAARAPPSANTYMQRAQVQVKEQGRGKQGGNAGGFMVFGAPWEQKQAGGGKQKGANALDTSDREEFPSIGNGGGAAVPLPTNGWNVAPGTGNHHHHHVSGTENGTN